MLPTHPLTHPGTHCIHAQQQEEEEKGVDMEEVCGQLLQHVIEQVSGWVGGWVDCLLPARS